MTGVNEWLAVWWPFLMIPVVWIFAGWLTSIRDAHIRATTQECPTCHGLGRINREEVAP